MLCIYLCAAVPFGGLLPVVYCMRMAQGRWRQHAISAMMRFLVMVTFWRALLTGIGNTLFITGFTAIWQTNSMDSCFVKMRWWCLW